MKLNIRLLMTGLLVQLAVSLVAQNRLFVISDPHVISPELVADKEAFAKEQATSIKMTDKSCELMQALVDTILQQRPDAVLIPGDLTMQGARASHLTVQGYLKQLREAGIKVYVIPGNHDVNNRNAVRYDGASTTSVPSVTSEEFATIYSDMGYGEDVERDAASLSYSCEPIEGLYLIAIDDNNTIARDTKPTASTNGIPASTEEWVWQQAAKAQAEGKQVIAMMHHQLVEHFDKQSKVVVEAAVDKASVLRDAFISHGIRLVLTGHMHLSNVTTYKNAEMADSLVEITTGAPIVYPCHYRMIDVSPDRSEFNVTTGKLSNISGYDGDFQDYARERILASSKGTFESLIRRHWSRISKKMENYVDYFEGRNFTQEYTSEFLYGIMKGTFDRAELFILEGNEGQAGAADVIYDSLVVCLDTVIDSLMPGRDSFSTAIIKAGIIYMAEENAGDVFRSVLTDCTNYGTDAANVTDDLSPRIVLPSSYVPSGIRSVSGNQSSARPRIFTADGREISGSTSLSSLPTGFYVIKEGTKSKKIIVN